MNSLDALLAVAAITGLLAMLFSALGMVADYLWPMLLSHDHRGQAHYTKRV